MKTHPAAELFPLLEGAAFDALVADIKEHGQIHPIVTCGGLLLDGRNRLAACAALGIAPKLTKYTGKDPLGYVVGANLTRRHLDASQRAMMGARLRPLYEAEAKERMLSGTLAPDEARGRSADKAAQAVNVSGAGVERAAKVLGAGAVATIKAVDAGELSVTRAAKIAGLPKSEQREAVKEALDPAGDGPDADAVEYTEEDQAREHAADFEALLKIVDSDDKLKAAVEELRAERVRYGQLERLYRDQGRQVADLTKVAGRWMRKAKKSAACQDCMTALERE